MGFGPIVNQIRESRQRSARTGPIVRMVWHHQAGTNDDAAINMMVTGSREVSATYTVSNEGRITGVVPEEFRPWTSSSAKADGQALTVEVENSSGAPSWGISDAAHEACARIAAYAFTQYGVPLDRAHHIGHREVLGIFGQGYATACPGNLDIDRIINRARQIIEGDDDMYMDNPDQAKVYMASDIHNKDVIKNIDGVNVSSGDILNALERNQRTILATQGATLAGVKANAASIDKVTAIVAALNDTEADASEVAEAVLNTLGEGLASEIIGALGSALSSRQEERAARVPTPEA